MSQIKTIIDKSKLKPIRQAKPNWSDQGIDWPVYRVKISDLHYNEDNGRIATWISTYTSNKDNKPLDSLTREEFNDVLEGFIRKANKEETMKELINDIKKKTQLNPGVILTDGTIVSGNRRFTALRNLYRENCDEKYEYFDCFIVDTPDTKDKFEFVKLIETKTQFSVVTEQDYDPIDRLVTIYKYLIDPTTKIWSVKDYAKKIGIKERDAENLYFRASIMVDYLKYINRPGEFHVARIQKLDGPIAELPNLYKQLIDTPKGRAEWNRIRPLFYSVFPPRKSKDDSKDRTRKVRSFKKMYNDNQSEFNALVAKLYAEAEKITEKMKEGTTEHTEYIVTDSGAVQARVSLGDQTIQDAITATQKQSARERPLKKAGAALSSLNEIETDIFSYMSKEEKDNLLKGLKEIEEKINSLKNKLNH